MKQERKKSRRIEIGVGSLNVGTMTGKGGELADLIMNELGVGGVMVAKQKR